MKLFLNTSSREKVLLCLDDKEYTLNTMESSSKLILKFIQKGLSKNKLTFNDISEVYVDTGPGSFTGLRVGVAITQTLSWCLKIPLNGNNFNETNQIKIVY